jgi:hypothetical protein
MPSPTYKLTPAGYLILMTVADARDSNEYGRAFGTYAGVDRLPGVPPPDPTSEELIRSGYPDLPGCRELIDAWLWARCEASSFICDHEKARKFRDGFESYGLVFELAYCELAWKTGEEDRLQTYDPVTGKKPEISETYGFDVSWPSCTHSAILQPGIVPNSPNWRERLNQHGLLDDYELAIQLREEYLRIYPHPPFDVYLVHGVR